ncbi:MAG: hypothetical protein PW790_02990 [Parvibaculaceae bacterium]|nr:hypothetical protein [Parvibaculaceae bacterium]
MPGCKFFPGAVLMALALFVEEVRGTFTSAFFDFRQTIVTFPSCTGASTDVAKDAAEEAI